MLTRGHFIGDIVDGFSDIANQASTRARLGLTDLHKFAEDFFKTALNHIYGLSLVNLNQDRSNEPGLDLGDAASGVAYQVTTQNKSQKMNETLAKVTDAKFKTYPKIYVLVIGKKQKKYTLDAVNSKRLSFSEDNIIDLDVLCRDCMNLPIDRLQTLYNHVRSELSRVKIDLEVPNEDGVYPTNIRAFTEAIPKPKMSNLGKYNAFLKSENEKQDIKKTKSDFGKLSAKLAKLPRITREFLCVMIERRENPKTADNVRINADKLNRISSYPDKEGELRLLQAYDLVYLDEPEDHGKSHHWSVNLTQKNGVDQNLLLQFIDTNGIPLQRPFVDLDFGDF